jgi:hypothetical protein
MPPLNATKSDIQYMTGVVKDPDAVALGGLGGRR